MSCPSHIQVTSWYTSGTDSSRSWKFPTAALSTISAQCGKCSQGPLISTFGLQVDGGWAGQAPLLGTGRSGMFVALQMTLRVRSWTILLPDVGAIGPRAFEAKPTGFSGLPHLPHPMLFSRKISGEQAFSGLLVPWDRRTGRTALGRGGLFRWWPFQRAAEPS